MENESLLFLCTEMMPDLEDMLPPIDFTPPWKPFPKRSVRPTIPYYSMISNDPEKYFEVKMTTLFVCDKCGFSIKVKKNKKYDESAKKKELLNHLIGHKEIPVSTSRASMTWNNELHKFVYTNADVVLDMRQWAVTNVDQLKDKEFKKFYYKLYEKVKNEAEFDLLVQKNERPQITEKILWFNKLLAQKVCQIQPKESDDDEFTHSNCVTLEETTRSIVLKWLIELCYCYRSFCSVYFLCVEYFNTYNASRACDDQFFLGIMCLFMASKLDGGLITLRIDTCIQILHEKTGKLVSNVDFKNFELEVAKVLKFDLLPKTSEDYIRNYCSVSCRANCRCNKALGLLIISSLKSEFSPQIAENMLSYVYNKPVNCKFVEYIKNVDLSSMPPIESNAKEMILFKHKANGSVPEEFTVKYCLSDLLKYQFSREFLLFIQ